MNKNFLKYKNASVHYLRFGHGAKLLIALHGFADQCDLFLELKESLEQEYTVYCLDLPFHGLTSWPDGEYNREDISALFKMILEKENKTHFDLMGFSLGGRIVMKMLTEWYSKVEKVFLIAPYGLTNNLDFIPQGLKTFLKNMLQNPGWFLRFIKILHRVGLLNRGHHNFARHHIQTDEKRNRLFNTWRSLYHFKLQARNVKSFFKEHPVVVELYFGAKDNVIPVAIGEKLSNGLPNVNLHVLETNHRLVHKELNTLLKQELL